MTCRKGTALLTCLALFAAAAPVTFAEGNGAAIAGVILDPSGKPAAGFKVVLVDVGSNKEFVSGLTDAQGNYTAKLPVGGRYRIDHVVASDGVTKLPVQDQPPVSVLTAGTTRLNVRFANTGTTTQAAGKTPSDEEEKKKKAAAVPWYHHPGAIVGIVLGAGAVLAVALSGGSDSSSQASAYLSTQ